MKKNGRPSRPSPSGEKDNQATG